MKTDPTIHALALQFAKERHQGGTVAYHYAHEMLTWLMRKPLADRLTTEERAEIKMRYDRREQTAELYLEATCINAQESSAIDYSKGYAQALHFVFGDAMFAEEGGEQ